MNEITTPSGVGKRMNEITFSGVNEWMRLPLVE